MAVGKVPVRKRWRSNGGGGVVRRLCSQGAQGLGKGTVFCAGEGAV